VPVPTRAELGPRRPGVRRGAPDRGPVIVLTAGSVRVLVPVPVRSFTLISRARIGKSNPAAPGASAGASGRAQHLRHRTPPRQGRRCPCAFQLHPHAGPRRAEGVAGPRDRRV